MAEVFLFQLMLRKLNKGHKGHAVLPGCSLEYVISPEAMPADKRIRASCGKEENVHMVPGCRVQGVGYRD
jgi:hypothetical protein